MAIISDVDLRTMSLKPQNSKVINKILDNSLHPLLSNRNQYHNHSKVYIYTYHTTVDP